MKPFYSEDLNDVSLLLRSFLEGNRITKMIDLGCGSGDLFYILSRHNLLPKYSVGVEINPVSCGYLREYLPFVKVICQDVRQTLNCINETFDLVCCEQVIEHLQDDVLLRLNPQHIREYKSAEEFISLLEKNGFKILATDIKKTPIILAHWIDAFLINFRIITDEKLRDWYRKSAVLRALRKRLVLYIPGFYLIEVLVESIKE